MDVNEIKPGLMVKVVCDDGTQGMIINPDILACRKVGKQGIVKSYVPGHGGDVWFVQQDNGIAAYCFTEIEAVEHSVQRIGLLAHIGRWFGTIANR